MKATKKHELKPGIVARAMRLNAQKAGCKDDRTAMNAVLQSEHYDDIKAGLQSIFAGTRR